MANVIYNSYKKNIETVGWETASKIKAMLVTSSYAPDIDNHANKSDVTDEVSGSGYTAGGNEITNRAMVQDNANDLAKSTADNVTFSDVSITTRGAVIYKDTGDDTTSSLIAYLDFGADQTITDADFELQWNEDGIFTIA